MKNGHGNDIHQQNTHVKVDFSSNVLPGGVSKTLQKHLQKHIQQIAHYPDVHSTQLRQQLATFHALLPENVLVTNGANEAFYLIAQWKRQQRSLVLCPTYAEYADACKIHHHKMHYGDLSNFEELAVSSVDIVWMSNPNNPTGYIHNSTHILQKLNTSPKAMFIVDEAYADCTTAFQSLDNKVIQHPNLMVVRSLTKQFAIPGLRLGYVLGNAENISILSALQIPWSVNRMAQLAGEYLFQHDTPSLNTSLFINEATTLCQQLNSLDGVEAFPGKCNFFIAQLQRHSAAQLKVFLMDKYGFLIRDASNFRGLEKGHFRIAAQYPSENQELILAIQHFLETHK